MNYKQYSEKILSELSSLLETDLKDDVRVVKFDRNQFLLHPGQHCHYYYVVKQGILVNYYLDEGKEIVTSFTFPNDIAADFKTSVFKQPSEDYILTLTECWVYRVNVSDFERHKNYSPRVSRLETGLISAYALLLEERLSSLQHRSAEKRYQFLVDNYPEFIQYIPLKYIASYLGITIETLSRMRAKI